MEPSSWTMTPESTVWANPAFATTPTGSDPTVYCRSSHAGYAVVEHVAMLEQAFSSKPPYV